MATTYNGNNPQVQMSYNPPLGPHPTNYNCPNCGQKSMTEIRFENSSRTHLFALLICLLGGVCCACIPYCVDSCKNANHYCGHCQAFLGTNTAK